MKCWIVEVTVCFDLFFYIYISAEKVNRYQQFVDALNIGEVSHDLLTLTLKFHHVPEKMISIISKFYTDYLTHNREYCNASLSSLRTIFLDCQLGSAASVDAIFFCDRKTLMFLMLTFIRQFFNGNSMGPINIHNGGNSAHAQGSNAYNFC